PLRTSATLTPPPHSPPFPYTTLFRSGTARFSPCAAAEHRDSLPNDAQAKTCTLYSGDWAVRVGTEESIEELAARLVRYAESIVRDRKSTRLNSSHRTISYAVFCLKKK